MTKTEREDAIKNCNCQLAAMEQILPTLATKEDVADTKRHTRVLFESLEDRIRIVADGYFALNDKMDGVTRRIDHLAERLEKKGTI